MVKQPSNKLFVQAYCSCGVSAYIPVTTEHINSMTIDNTIRKAGWRKIRLTLSDSSGVEDVWECNKCRERSSPDPQESI